MRHKLSDGFLTDAEVLEVQRYAQTSLQLWMKRCMYVGALLLLSCASVLPFSKGHSLHAHAEPFGRFLVWLTVGLVMLLTYCAIMAFVSCISLRDTLKSAK
jgi:hypothetical protein